MGSLTITPKTFSTVRFGEEAAKAPATVAPKPKIECKLPDLSDADKENTPEVQQNRKTAVRAGMLSFLMLGGLMAGTMFCVVNQHAIQAKGRQIAQQVQPYVEKAQEKIKPIVDEAKAAGKAAVDKVKSWIPGAQKF